MQGEIRKENIEDASVHPIINNKVAQVYGLNKKFE